LTLLYDAPQAPGTENIELQKEDSMVLPPKPVTREQSATSAFSADSLKSTDIEDAVRQLESLQAETNN